MPEVDVIVPAYNAERYLVEALDSVVAQTFPDWRIVLVDDGSTDGTAAIAKGYASRLGARMLYLYQANRGLPAARNTAIRNSDAELLALLDADDVWLPDRLAESVKVFRGRPEVGLAYGFIEGIDQHGEVISTFATASRHAQGHVAHHIYMRSLHLPCPTVTFRRQAALQAGLFDETLRASEDRDLWIRIAARYETALVSTLIAQYRSSPTAMTTDPERMHTAQLRVVEKHLGLPGCDRAARRVALSRIFRQRAEALTDRGRTLPALGSIGQSLWYAPSDRHSWKVAAATLRGAVRRRTG